MTNDKVSNQSSPTYSSRYKAYVLLLLTGVYTFNFIDRQILVILQESIKGELGLSDTQLGLLTGLAFAAFYVVLGFPIARLADRTNRRNVVGLSLAVWSAMTAISGLVANYIQLLLARIGVGIGEAGGSPPAHSIISDYFPPEKRATALSIYSTGIYIGILVGYTLGGWIDANYGWRMAFFAMGIPGIIYALLILFTVKEPPRGGTDGQVIEHQKASSKEIIGIFINILGLVLAFFAIGAIIFFVGAWAITIFLVLIIGVLIYVFNKWSKMPPVDRSKPVSFWGVMRILFNQKTFVLLALGCGLHTYGNYGVGNFFAPFLIRVHGMEVAAVGALLGLAAGIGGIVGTFSGGFLGDYLGKKDVRWYLWVAVVAGVINFVPAAISFFASNTTLVIATHFLSSLLTALYLAPCIAVTHNLVDARMRALASAVLFFILNLIGLGTGPLFIGMLSDYFAADFGAESLRWAFTSTFVTGTIACLCFYYAGKWYPEELAKIKE